MFRLEFKTPKEANETFRRNAYCAGFEISARDSTEVGSCRYYCQKGGRKRGNIYNKTNCPFYFKEHVKAKEDGTYLVSISQKKICSIHNHPLNTQKYALMIQNEEILQVIKNMLESDIQPHKIRKFL